MRIHVVTVHIIIPVIQKFSSENLVSQSFTTGNLPFPVHKFTIYTSNMYGYPRSSAAQRSSAPWRATSSGLRQRSSSGTLQQLCQHICQSVNVYTDQKSIFRLSKSRSAAQLTEWSLATSAALWVLPPPCTVGRDADSVANSHSAPIRVLYCLHSESGLFWAV